MHKKVVVILDGGAGRVIAAEPALRKFVENNPSTDLRVIVFGWERLFLSHPILQNKVYSADSNGLFEFILKDADVVLSPEPYRVPGYYRQELSMSQAFDLLINNETNTDAPRLYTSKLEQLMGSDNLLKVKSEQKKQKTIIIQPFGRSATIIETTAGNKKIIDSSGRGLGSQAYLKLVRKLSLKYNLVLFAEPEFHLKDDTYTAKITNPDLRYWLSLISKADYFVGVDSVGQHMARSMDRPGYVIIGSTYSKNVTYPEHFGMFEAEQKQYTPIRLTPKDNELADRMNESCLDLSDEQIDKIIEDIITHVENKQ